MVLSVTTAIEAASSQPRTRRLSNICRCALSTALVLAPLGVAQAKEDRLFEWTNNTLGFRYGNGFTNPNNPRDISKRIFNVSHADGYRYGSNFFNLDLLQSDSNDPRKGSTHGSREVYGLFRSQLFASRIFDWQQGSGLVKDYAFTFGFDASRNNNLGSAKKRALLFGPTVKFNGPGVLDLSLFYYREKNHSDLPNVKYPDHIFDTTYMLNLAWLRPFQLGDHSAKFQGFLNYTAEKGKDYNNNDTAPETLIRASLMFAMVPGTKRQPNLWLGMGYEYWHNKFGVDGGRGTRTSTPTVNIEFTF
ncbi:nucleoside-binding protein [Aeromonas cavernicola]|uniref:Nucleoside-binding protein n=1 Tax=Aeromonas cavernicola TaxID=1006623 RepID=A0A2H9U1Q6_9GAMM|nr:nucleoside-binding protein [Aeromonas cavernicola]PJG57997.1 nucleoside-binding protein [Aeromonas cavernicola]